MNLTERVARALFAYDNSGRGIGFDDADADELAPYYDLAAIAVEVITDDDPEGDA